MRYDYPLAPGYMEHGVLMSVFGLLFFLLIVVVIFRLIRHGQPDFRWHGQQWGGSHMTARDILSERYAKGELTKTEYESMKSDIAQDTPVK